MKDYCCRLFRAQFTECAQSVDRPADMYIVRAVSVDEDCRGA